VPGNPSGTRGFRMERIIFRIKILCTFTAIVTISTALLAYACFTSYEGVRFLCPYVTFVIIINILLIAVLGRTLYRHWQGLLRAKVIRENNLLHITEFDGIAQCPFDLYFSPFGMLIDDRIIPFDPRSNPLTGFELNGGQAVVTYGTLGKEEQLLLPRFSPEQVDWENFGHRLEYETGVSLNVQ
jgi:hypothetical protein